MKNMEFRYKKVNKDEVIDELSEVLYLRNFFIDNDLSSDEIENNLSRLFSFKNENEKCIDCEGLNKCTQDATGLRPHLAYENNRIKTFYRECKFLRHRNEQHKKDALIDSLYMPKMILNADITDYDVNTESRISIYNYMMRFISLYPTGEKLNGMYIHGEYQRGKTYTLAVIAKELTKKGYQVVLAYFPDLVREFKSSNGNNTLETLINKMKQADILMLDDIGGESNSAWIRDEVLGPILQYRLLDEKPTFFSSNLSIKDLARNMQDNNQTASQLKAARIAARISSLTTEFQLK